MGKWCLLPGTLPHRWSESGAATITLQEGRHIQGGWAARQPLRQAPKKAGSPQARENVLEVEASPACQGQRGPEGTARSEHLSRPSVHLLPLTLLTAETRATGYGGNSVGAQAKDSHSSTHHDIGNPTRMSLAPRGLHFTRESGKSPPSSLSSDTALESRWWGINKKPNMPFPPDPWLPERPPGSQVTMEKVPVSELEPGQVKFPPTPPHPTPAHPLFLSLKVNWGARQSQIPGNQEVGVPDQGPALTHVEGGTWRCTVCSHTPACTKHTKPQSKFQSSWRAGQSKHDASAQGHPNKSTSVWPFS